MPGIKKNKSIAFISPLGLPLLQIPPKAGPGGAERQFFLFGKGLEKRGWSVYYITDNINSRGGIETVMPVETASFSFMRGGGKGRMLLDWISVIHAIWKANSYYYVIKTPAYLLVPMSMFTKLFGRKLVFWAQMDFDAYPELRPPGRLLGIFLDLGIKLADIILAQNKRQVEGFKNNFGRESHLIRNISGNLCSDDLPDSEASSVDILWVGNSMAKKRYEVMVELAILLPDYSFAIAMNKADQKRYQEAERRCNEASNIRFLGEVNPVEMESWFGKTKLLVNTSAQEGFPNTYLQAWQRGVPVVSLCIDPDDLVTRHGLGIVVDKHLTHLLEGDEHTYAKLLISPITKLLTDDSNYGKLSENVRAYVAENHSESVLVSRLEQILNG